MAYASLAVAVFQGLASSAQAETRTYSYNARGELIASTVAGGPANGMQTNVGYDAAGNRSSYQTSGSNAPPVYRSIVVVPVSGLSLITVPQ